MVAIHQTDSLSLLKQLKTLPSGQKRGMLRIYFGYASGVGKTCAMLRDAREAKDSGIDVVAGYIEPHICRETTSLLEGLESLDPLDISEKDHKLSEFDLDSALKRHPELILVDGLAHTNGSGCRHKKRYQDVEELLKAGINVYTTVNVQHMESLTDIVETITGVYEQERIPDRIFDEADQVELVDIEPDDLIDRLNKGKVSKDHRTERELTGFYTKEKLIALREIALRLTADKVNRIAARIENESNSRGYSNEHILVCLSSAPSNAKVIRTAARLAEAFKGTFTALFVETPAAQKMSEKYKEALMENLRLAEQLGAQISTVYGEDVPVQIAEYAKIGRVSKIVMGRSLRTRRWLKRNYMDTLTELAPAADIYIIPDTQSAFTGYAFKFGEPERLSLADTFKSLALLAVCTCIGFLFDILDFSMANIITVYILGVQVNAVFTKGRLYSVVSSILSVLIVNYFFTDPRISFRAAFPSYPVTFLIMLTAALITSTLTRQIKEQARQSSEKAFRTEVLLETSQKLQQAKDRKDILKETAHQMLKLLDRTIIFYPANQEGLEMPEVFLKKGSEEQKALYLGIEERAVAEWVFKNNKQAGAATETLSEAKCLYLAVQGGGKVLAVAGISMEGENHLEAFEKSIVTAILGECSLALEKEELNETRKEISMQMQQEKLRANLLRGISHDLRTPLTSISGNAGILISNSGVISEEEKRNLYTDIYDDSMWLINLVENLLSITRIDNGGLHLTMHPDLISEVIAEALLHINRNHVDHVIRTEVSDELLMAKMDSQLIMQVIVNIIDNAIKYTPKGSVIVITARREGTSVCVEIADNGKGVSHEAKEKLFDMFYTADNTRGDGRRGIGLGLSLCKSIIHAHGGKIYIKDNVPTGTILGFTLQAEEVILHE